jgi:FtsH-binding integral membrane protein
MTDLESGTANTQNAQYNQFDLSKGFEPNLRLGFIRKVYGILSVQLVITVLFSILSMETGLGAWQVENLGLFYMAWVVNIVSMISVFCFKSNARQVPTNYILCSVFTLTEAYMVSTICTLYDPELVLMAALMTAAMTIALTIYACTTKTDMTYHGASLFILACGIFLLSIFNWIFQNPFLEVFICVCAIVVYGFYLVYDTQLIAGGKAHELSIDDYVIGAIIIYIDVIILFLRILRLLAILKGRD